jgi:transcriptional regulator with XRE-family HTH domain
MTSEAYAEQRRLRGSQRAVAKQLGVSHITIARRETGVIPITREAELALSALAPRKKQNTDYPDQNSE